MSRKLVLILSTILVIVSASLLVMNRESNQAPVLDTPSGGDFSLQSINGTFNLQDHRGKIVLIYFGYTFCPDICPTNLALMAQTLNALEANESKLVTAVFISVDPERDNLTQLKNYTNFFHPQIIGVTGEQKDIDRIARQYGAAYQKVTGESEGGYLIDHSSFTYLVDDQGKLSMSFPHATNPMDMISAIRSYLH